MSVEYRTDPDYFEYLDGHVYAKVSPRRKHSFVQAALLTIARRLAGDLGFVGAEWRFRLGAIDGTDSALLPDISFISHARLAALAPEQREEPPVAPDVAIEIRSPSTRRRLLEAKIRRYLGCGTYLVLDVDPERRTIAAHALDSVTHYKSGDRFEHPAVPWLAFDVAEAFIDLDRLE